MTAFATEERNAQTSYFSQFSQDQLMPGWAYRLHPDHAHLNLNSAIRQDLSEHFDDPANRIEWHRHANHALSSQVCCLNFLAPLMRRPEALSQVVGAGLGIAAPEMLPVGRDRYGKDIYVDFEWIGLQDYLGEWRGRSTASRGANATSADAIARMTDASGTVTTLLIEWKYTEAYGKPLDAKGNPTRIGWYKDKAFAPTGPLRSHPDLTLEHFFWEPFYQLLRQQMLAFRMEQAREAGADRVVVLHISASGNEALHRVTSEPLREYGTDAFDVFRSLLVDPSRFTATSIEAAFLPALSAAVAADPTDPWASYLLDRYTFLRARSA